MSEIYHDFETLSLKERFDSARDEVDSRWLSTGPPFNKKQRDVWKRLRPLFSIVFADEIVYADHHRPIPLPTGFSEDDLNVNAGEHLLDNRIAYLVQECDCGGYPFPDFLTASAPK